MTDRNGYNDSLFITKPGRCFLSGYEGETARHEVFQGSNRKNSKEDGLWVNVLPEFHNKWHNGKIEDIKKQVQRNAELLWLQADWTRSIQDFVDRYGRNYL